ncbi:hypothetical protein J6590_011543 [Homalodisca vitripennis]|nr:hypothetical protein J6590_011543 [Homalodisca vitripennis]
MFSNNVKHRNKITHRSREQHWSPSPCGKSRKTHQSAAFSPHYHSQSYYCSSTLQSVFCFNSMSMPQLEFEDSLAVLYFLMSKEAMLTGISLVVKSLNINRQRFKADHPFLFYLISNRGSIVLFTGRFSLPTHLQ